MTQEGTQVLILILDRISVRCSDSILKVRQKLQQIEIFFESIFIFVVSKIYFLFMAQY